MSHFMDASDLILISRLCYRTTVHVEVVLLPRKSRCFVYNENKTNDEQQANNLCNEKTCQYRKAVQKTTFIVNLKKKIPPSVPTCC